MLDFRRVPSRPRYTGPATPTHWDPDWQKFTNLNRAQIEAFQAMPEDLHRYAEHSHLHHSEGLALVHPNGLVIMGSLDSSEISIRSKDKNIKDFSPAEIGKAHDAYLARATRHKETLARVKTAIDGRAIRSRAQIDAAFKD